LKTKKIVRAQKQGKGIIEKPFSRRGRGPLNGKGGASTLGGEKVFELPGGKRKKEKVFVQEGNSRSRGVPGRKKKKKKKKKPLCPDTAGLFKKRALRKGKKGEKIRLGLSPQEKERGGGGAMPPNALRRKKKREGRRISPPGKQGQKCR